MYRRASQAIALMAVAVLSGACDSWPPPAGATTPAAAPPASTTTVAPAPVSATRSPADPPSDARTPVIPEVPPAITDADLPPLPVTSFPAARPMDVVRAVYTFAAKHPEVLRHVPCFCGCQAQGHRNNDDCFVTARDARGRPTVWEPHGIACAICIDVARDSMQMHASGARVADIRAAIEQKYRTPNGTMTPTPPVK